MVRSATLFMLGTQKSNRADANLSGVTLDTQPPIHMLQSHTSGS